MPIDFVLAQPQTASDTIKIKTPSRQTPPRHHPDTPRQRRIYVIEGTVKKSISEYNDLSEYFRFGIDTSPTTSGAIQIHPDIIQTPSRHPQTPNEAKQNAQ